MSATANGYIRYSDLLDGVYTALLSVAKNVGSDYDSSVPEELKYPYTPTYQGFPTTEGYRPRVVWANSSKCAVVSESQFSEDFNSYCADLHLTDTDNQNTFISMPTVIKFMTAILAFVTSRFVVVYSVHTSETSIFYIHDNPIMTSALGVTSHFAMEFADVQWLVDKVVLAATNPSKSFNAIEGYTLYGN